VCPREDEFTYECCRRNQWANKVRVKSRLGHFNNALYSLELNVVTVMLQVCNGQQGLEGDHSRSDDDGIYTLPFCAEGTGASGNPARLLL
jgi:hypothetical protein